MKNPNGYGSVFKLSGNRRKPWAVRVTTGWTDEGKQKFTYLGYYKTRKEAVIELAKYNDQPYNVDKNRLTFKEIYEMFISDNKDRMSDSVRRVLEMAYNLSSELHDKRFAKIRKKHMQDLIDESDKAYSTKKSIRSLFYRLYKYAIENDLADRNYAQFVTVKKEENISVRKPFTLEEIELLWGNLGKHEAVDGTLVMIYTGMRPGELIDIDINNVHLDDRYLIGGIKTDAGKDRIIPLHKKIVPIIEKKALNSKSDKLSFFDCGRALGYASFRNRFSYLMNKLKMVHRPHDCRHTFATLMDNAGANKVSIQRIMGHASQGVTDAIYTHKDVDELKKAVDLLD